MHTIIIAIIIVAVVGFSIWGLVSIHNKEIGKMAADLLSRFEEAAQKENLKFSKMEVLGNLIMGLDDSCNKLLILKKTRDEYHSLVINLNDVKDCSKLKKCHRIDINRGKGEKYENYIEEILLSLDIPHQVKENITFYDPRVYGLRDLTQSQQKANEWETTIKRILLSIHQEKGLTRIG